MKLDSKVFVSPSLQNVGGKAVVEFAGVDFGAQSLSVNGLKAVINELQLLAERMDVFQKHIDSDLPY